MNIYLIDLNNFDKTILAEFEKNCETASTKKNKLKKEQHLAGRYIVDFVAKNIYKIQDRAITYDGQKPVFKKAALYFSISHCKNLVAVGFSKNNIGIDIECNKKDRDFAALIERFDKNLADKIEPLSKEKQKKIFYEFWTKYEAKIKLANEYANCYYYSVNLDNDFTLSAASEVEIKNMEIRRL